MTSPSSSNDTKTTFEEIYFYPRHQYKEPQDTLIVMMFEMVDSIGSDVEDHERWFLEVYSSNVLKDLSAVSRASPLGYNNIFLNNFENIFQIFSNTDLDDRNKFCKTKWVLKQNQIQTLS